MRGTREENQRIMIKKLPTWTKNRERKSRLLKRRRVCLRRDLDDKGPGQNKVLCSFSGAKLLTIKAFQYSLRQRDRFPATYQLLPLELQ